MSGIAAIINFDGRPVSEAEIARMTAAMHYRGPDGISHWVSGDIGLAACIMHSTAESREATMPWRDEHGRLALVLDGYIGNYEELRRELLAAGAALRNLSDAELVLRAYQQWGADCAAHIEGEFAFVIWNAAERELFCARDHQGLRPLFWRREGHRLILASDFAAIHAAAEGEIAPNDNVLVQIMAAQWYFTGETVWQGVERILPAHHTRFTRDGAKAQRYWSLPRPYSIRYSSDGEYAEHYLEVLSQSVRRACRTDSKAGFEVSGGLDSSAVFAVADRLADQGQLPAPDMAGYALAGPEGSRADEAEYIDAVAAHLDRPISKSPLHLPQLEWFMDQARRDADIPYYPNGTMMLRMYQQMAADGCRVALSGLGGDEWLNGRPSHYAETMAHWDAGQLLRSLAASRKRFGAGPTMRAAMRSGLRPILVAPVKRIARKLGHEFMRPPPAAPWLSDRAAQMLAASKEQYDRYIQQSPMPENRLRMLTFPMNAMILEQASRIRSRNNLEGRHPLLSRSFIEFSAATPEATRLRGGERKFLHRRALHGLLPEKVLRRQDKAEFGKVLDAQIQPVSGQLAKNASPAFESLTSKSGLKHLSDLAIEANRATNWKWPFWGVFGSLTLFLHYNSHDEYSDPSMRDGQ